MKFHITHEHDGIYQGLLVEAGSQRIAEAYFRDKKPENRVVGIHVARAEDMKPGKPEWVVPKEFAMDFIKGHQRAFLEKMAELEEMGFRSGGWDEKTDKTAIVRSGKREIDNAIVGYMDRDLNIEWETKVLSVARADERYLEGTVFVEGEVYPFDYDVVTEGVDVHCYSEPGWMTGASYEKPLPEVVTKNMDEILAAIDDAVHDFLSVEELKKEQGLTVAELLDEQKFDADCSLDVLDDRPLEEKLKAAQERSRNTIPGGDDGSGPNGGAGGDPERVKEKADDFMEIG